MVLRRVSWLLIAALCCGCAENTVLGKAGLSKDEMQRDQQHCKGEMYSQRMARGRSAPSWTIYDYCMKGRGYSREKLAS
jgi:hypothetical protein